MPNQKHLDMLAKGAKAWNEWRAGEEEDEPDLSEVRFLERAKLAGFNLAQVNLSCSNLRGADFGLADLQAADLSGANLQEADLTGVSLASANLTDTDFRGARLSHVIFGHATVSPTVQLTLRPATTILLNTKFDRARMSACYFQGVDVSKAQGLDSVEHLARSSIDLETIYMSGGQIPESFLRGAGVPENFITFMTSLTGEAFEFYSCFISYSTKDQDFADRLYADMQAKGVRCWFAPHDIQGGRKVHEQIEEAIKVYDKLLLILSEASMNSKWVKTEIANARSKEQQQKRQMLFPISLVSFDRIKGWKLFDADTGIDSAREIREYFIPDFSHWRDHDSYTNTFEGLLRDLKAGRALCR
jgi:hypothetical protein